MPARKPQREVLPLTSLRFFLASWIVVYHLYVSFASAYTQHVLGRAHLLPNVFTAYVAVGMFFMLSGFILALNYPPGRKWTRADARSFFLARLSRIYPVYLLSLLAMVPFVLGPALVQHDRALVLRRAASGATSLLLLQAWLPRVALSWNGPGWSISDEAFFYLCFPLLAAALFRPAALRRCVAVLLGLWFVALVPPALAMASHVHGFSDAVATQNPDLPFAAFIKFNPLLNLAMFLAGVTVCRCYLLLKASRALHRRGYVLYGPGLLLLFTVTAMADRVPYPLMHNGLLLPAHAAIILGLALGDRFLCTLLSNRLLVFLGKASYAEYLLHLPVRLLFDQLGASWTPLCQVVYLLAVLCVSALVFRFFEDPLQRRLRQARWSKSSSAGRQELTSPWAM